MSYVSSCKYSKAYRHRDGLYKHLRKCTEKECLEKRRLVVQNTSHRRNITTTENKSQKMALTDEKNSNTKTNSIIDDDIQETVTMESCLSNNFPLEIRKDSNLCNANVRKGISFYEQPEDLIISSIDAKIMETSNRIAHLIRVYPEQDLLEEIRSYIYSNNIQASYIMTCRGTLKKINVKLPGKNTFLTLDQKFEIISITGNISTRKEEHLHIRVIHESGLTIEGELLDGNIIYIGAEIIIGVFPNFKF